MTGLPSFNRTKTATIKYNQQKTVMAANAQAMSNGRLKYFLYKLSLPNVKIEL
jgi:hypothetical protein